MHTLNFFMKYWIWSIKLYKPHLHRPLSVIPHETRLRMRVQYVLRLIFTACNPISHEIKELWSLFWWWKIYTNMKTREIYERKERNHLKWRNLKFCPPWTQHVHMNKHVRPYPHFINPRANWYMVMLISLSYLMSMSNWLKKGLYSQVKMYIS